MKAKSAAIRSDSPARQLALAGERGVQPREHAEMDAVHPDQQLEMFWRTGHAKKPSLNNVAAAPGKSSRRQHLSVITVGQPLPA